MLRQHSDLGRLASLDALRAGSGGITNHTTPSSEYHRQRLRAEGRQGQTKRTARNLAITAGAYERSYSAICVRVYSERELQRIPS